MFWADANVLADPRATDAVRPHGVRNPATRENLYVSMTRGRDSNIAYVALDQPDDSHSAPEHDEVSGRSLLHGVLRHSGAELSAHQSIKTEQDRWTSIAQLAAEYETIAAVAQRDRWTDLLASAGLTDDQLGALLGSDSFGPLTAELRRAEANNLNLESELPRLITRRTLADADDIGAVLISRIQQAEAQASTHRRKDSQRLIAGLIPRASGAMAPDMAEALIQRQHLIETRVSALAEASLAKQKGWLTRLGTPPAGGRLLERWLQELRTVIAYRDRYAVDSDVVLGNARSDAQRLDHARAAQAIRRARTISDEACDPSPAVDPRTAVRGRSH